MTIVLHNIHVVYSPLLINFGQLFGCEGWALIKPGSRKPAACITIVIIIDAGASLLLTIT